MDFHSQFRRELKSALIWFFIPWAGLMSAITTVWNWYVSGAIDFVRLIQLIGSVAAVIVCGYFTRKTHLQWQVQVQAGTTEIGEVLYTVPTASPGRDGPSIITAIVLLAILVIGRPAFIAPFLILGLAFISWWQFLSTFMTAGQCIIGKEGLWIVFMGDNTAVPYSAIKQAQLQPNPNDELRLKISGPDLPHGHMLLHVPLDQAALNVLKDHISIELPNDIPA